MTDVYVLGDSHISALLQAMKRRGDGRPFMAGCAPVVSRFEKIKQENGTLLAGLPEEEVLARLAGADADTTFVSLIGGNQFNAFGMMQHPAPFDFFEPDLPRAPVDKHATIIPVAVLEDMFLGFIGGRDGSQLQRIRAAFGGRLFHLVPPPPKEDDAFVLETAETYFRERGIAGIGVSPALLRLKLWFLQIRVTGAFCRANDIVMLHPPAGTIDGPGYLARNYYGPDATHANAAYGERVLDMIETDLFPTTEAAR